MIHTTIVYLFASSSHSLVELELLLMLLLPAAFLGADKWPGRVHRECMGLDLNETCNGHSHNTQQ